MKEQLADIATNEKQQLNGFRVLGVFPFYLKYITTGTHIQLSSIRSKIQLLLQGREPKVSDFYDAKLQTQLIPLLNQYLVTALLNSRDFSWFFKPFLYRKIKRCGHYHVLNLYVTIYKLDEPAFFLTYWNLILQQDHTLLKEAKPS